MSEEAVSIETGGEAKETGPEKVGAGILFTYDGEALLLRRSATSGNPGTLGLPGGNKDAEDKDLMTTALREATEEMGLVPPHVVLGQIFTRRGKRLQKHYTVFVASVLKEIQESWKPTLNDEHVDFEWINLRCAASRPDLHPVVALLLRDPGHQDELFTMLGLSQLGTQHAQVQADEPSKEPLQYS